MGIITLLSYYALGCVAWIIFAKTLNALFDDQIFDDSVQGSYVWFLHFIATAVSALSIPVCIIVNGAGNLMDSVLNGSTDQPVENKKIQTAQKNGVIRPKNTTPVKNVQKEALKNVEVKKVTGRKKYRDKRRRAKAARQNNKV